MSVLRRDPAAVVVALVAVACALACCLVPGEWSRIPFALPLVLALPGWALHRALALGGRDPLRVVAYSVGLSVALSVVGGVKMGTYEVFSTTAWALMLAGTTVAGCVVAVIRARRGEEVAAARPRTAAGARAGALVTAGLSLLLIGAAIGLARTPLPVPADRGYTELSFGPTARGDDAVTITVASREARTRTMTLRVSAPGRTPLVRSLVLTPGDVVRERIAVPPGARGAIEARLVRAAEDGGGTYRRISIGLPLRDPAPAVSPRD